MSCNNSLKKIKWISKGLCLFCHIGVNKVKRDKSRKIDVLGCSFTTETGDAVKMIGYLITYLHKIWKPVLINE